MAMALYAAQVLDGQHNLTYLKCNLIFDYDFCYQRFVLKSPIEIIDALL